MISSTIRRAQRLNSSVINSYIEISKYAQRQRASQFLKPSYSCILQKRYTNEQGRQDPGTLEPLSSHNLLQNYKSTLQFPAPTVRVKDISSPQVKVGDVVIIHGYATSLSAQSRRLYFMNVLDQDLEHSIQAVWNRPKDCTEEETSLHDRVKNIEPNTPIALNGIIKQRHNEGQLIWHSIKDLEIELRNINILNPFPKDIIAVPETTFPPEQRHLQLRFGLKGQELRHALRFRSRAMRLCREELEKQIIPFTELETPVLFKSTPEGAREFIVPTRRQGYAYALPQSPQQYKQILMASGFSRYFQFAKCFRDEDLRADRQPEFTQLDLEMSFVTGEEVMQCVETVIKRLWTELLGVGTSTISFPRMTYTEAMSSYGSDKPDLRIGMKFSRIQYLLPVDLISKITDLTDPIVEMMTLPISEDPRETRDFISKFMDSPDAEEFIKNPDGGPGIFVFDSRKPLQGLQPLGFEAAEVIGENLQDGDLVVLQARKDVPFTGGSTPLGILRRALHKAAVESDFLPPPEGFDFRWITDFPLFSPSTDTDPGQGGGAGITSTHHPFTSPKTAADVDMLLSDPLNVTGDHYDLVVNGVELGGGSRRIHSAEMQEFVLREILKMPPEKLSQFSHLLEALRAGCPPHAGIALGFDRLITVMLGRDSVRDVIAFPKSGKGEDPMVKSPSALNVETLETYHLALKGQ